MKSVSVSTGFETTMIANLSLNGLIIEDIFYACQYENDWYIGIANFVSIKYQDLNIKFLHPKGSAVQLFWSSWDDICWIPISNVICKVQPPESSSTGRFYKFHSYDISHGFYKVLKSPHKILSPPMQGSPPFLKILNMSPLKGCCLDWRCFLN